ncbi:Maf family protein [Mycetocola reblochoni]|uniref:Nucleoside triphosphate pyrophosphatase n=2 Tax=Mycetocola reblochoni TaxID=331618 RepID=A0A1R4K0A9_9MICO|nr:Maf family protein [Mycetocola reblochoni]RLP70494.1 septum formation protein Maf [Mycetocola reblochoni]SJN37648.1 Septum formation protein Maf [Mycetocola reblochoni REB411]
MTRLYLASTSPARLALLAQIGVEPVVVPSRVDEPAAVEREQARLGREMTTPEMVALLARAKAEAVADRCADGIVLGGDSSFLLDGRSLGKPHTAERAAARWRENRGATGVLWSGLHLIDTRSPDRPSVTRTDAAEVRFADDITEEEILDYVASGEPLEVAGAFTIDGLAAPLIAAVSGAPSAVIGLSLPGLRLALAELGVGLAELRAGR